MLLICFSSTNLILQVLRSTSQPLEPETFNNCLVASSSLQLYASFYLQIWKGLESVTSRVELRWCSDTNVLSATREGVKTREKWLSFPPPLLTEKTLLLFLKAADVDVKQWTRWNSRSYFTPIYAKGYIEKPYVVDISFSPLFERNILHHQSCQNFQGHGTSQLPEDPRKRAKATGSVPMSQRYCLEEFIGGLNFQEGWSQAGKASHGRVLEAGLIRTLGSD